MDSKIFLVMLALATVLMFSVESCVSELAKTRPVRAEEKPEEPAEEYTRDNPGFSVTTSVYASEDGETVEVKTCGCQGCHWRCN